MHTMNDEQQQVSRAIQAMQGGDRLVVSGRAGSGKTYAIANSVGGRKALFLAPTHPACAVLEQELAGKRHIIATIHSAIGWRQERDEDANMVDTYRPASDPSNRSSNAPEANREWFPGVEIIVVDEFSMVGSFLFDAVEDYATEFNLPVVYSGDRYQLPPVRDQEVIMDQGFTTITMEGSLRFPKESDIFKLGEILRDAIENKPNDDLQCIFGIGDVTVLKGRQWMDQLTKSYGNGSSLLAVASDNDTLSRLRGKVRQLDHDRLSKGDMVTSKKTDDVFRNGDQLTIKHVSECIHRLDDIPACISQDGTIYLDGFSISFTAQDEIAFILGDQAASKRLAKKVRENLSSGNITRKQAIRILDWLELPQEFELSALATVHKSQGRSVDTVYIDTRTVVRQPSYLSPLHHKRLLYTAITRARKNVVFYAMQGHCELPVSTVVEIPQPCVVNDVPALTGLAA
jgi:hypothetical protein